MSDDLLHYYQRELNFIREMGAEFARRYPKIAARLQLAPDKCEDPHTERLIEAFSLLTGRLHKRIEDHFPEITEALFQVLYPHYVAPVPSMAVASFEPLTQAVPPTGYLIDKNTVLYSKPVEGTPCQFTTGYPVTLWPIEVASAVLSPPQKPARNAQQALNIRLQAADNVDFGELSLKELRFFLNGKPQDVYLLYERIFNNLCHLELSWSNARGGKETVTLRPDDIREVGFKPDDSIIPHDSRTFSGYSLLFQFFAFPEKFLFFDLCGLGQLAGREVGRSIEVSFYFDRGLSSDVLVTRSTFCLNATPVVNLFRKTAEPINIDHQLSEYQIVPDLRRRGAAEVFSVDRVMSTTTGADKETLYRPLYSLSHYLEEPGGSSHAYWHLRREQGRNDDGTDVYISFANLDFDPVIPGAEVVHLQVTCTNRGLPGRLPIGDPAGDFDTELAAPLAAIRCVVKPTLPRRPVLGGPLQWRLISHLSLNYLPLLDDEGETLKEILKLYDFDDSPATKQQINGIVSLRSQFVTKRVGPSFCRGVEVTIRFDEEKYVGTGLYLFACVLERFIGEYVSLNSFTRLVAETLQRKERLKAWPPRNGRRILL